MRVIFMGSPDFAAQILQNMILQGKRDASIDIVAVCTMPPRPAKRGQKPQATDVAMIAEQYRLPLLTPDRLDDAFLTRLMAFKPDMILVVAYGMKLPKSYCEACEWGAVNIHASLLPHFRGASPIQAAILAGCKETGVTLMQMDEGLDSGGILMQESVPLSDNITAPELRDILQQLGQKMIIDYIQKGVKITARPQDETQVSYAPKITRDDGRIDFTRDDAPTLCRKMRAFTGWPNLWFMHQRAGNDAVRLIVHEAVACEGDKHAPAGTVISLETGIKVQCNDIQDKKGQSAHSALNITKIQKIGGKILSWRDFLNGYPLNCQL
ncbi:MAG: methionyl-tRNA formyltransferase [Alphaproteobacteria bacterium]|nr:methionyl-tRNA formyltransferase [Alphaproteobacteria bacterium]